MVDSDWERMPAPPSGGVPARVVGIVPLPADLGGNGEILALAAFGSVKLPVGEIRPGESVRAAANRIVIGMTGVSVTAERLLYVLEQAGKHVTLCMLCALDTDQESESDRPGVRFVPIRDASELDPPALRELLVEDAQAGFVRPVAFVTAGFDDEGRERVTIDW